MVGFEPTNINLFIYMCKPLHNISKNLIIIINY